MYSNKPFTKEDSLNALNPKIREWFESKYKELSPPQLFSFKLIKEEKNILITAPTGSGKTFSAFMAILSYLFDLAENNKLEDKVYCIYISPLRALNNDVYRNLSEPLNEIYSKYNIENKIRVGIRTGDTPASERQKQNAKPPHILVTTPESLAIILNTPRFIEHLKNVRYVVVDEIHELANNKRGVHLSLSLERLNDLIGHDFIRIGLGATLNPLEEAARFLVGYDEKGSERDCIIVDATWDKKMEFITISPVKDIVNETDEKIEESIYKILDSIIKSNRTTLIFTNTRSGTERVVYNLKRKYNYKDEELAAHHGSLSREVRLGVEEQLKLGKLKCVVSSTSLELGIDIGSIDNVVQIGSPKSITRAIQRIGRSGHSFNAIAKGEIIVINRDDLVECTVMLDRAKKRFLDSFNVPKNPLDVLAQHIVGMALNKKWKIDEALNVIRRAYPYHNLDKKDFISVIAYLSGMYVGLESRRVYGKIWYDEAKGEFGRRGKYTRVIYYLNLGTIPDEVSIDVYTLDKKWIGDIEEEFLERLKPGDVFVLGGKLYRFERAVGMKCFVTKAEAQTPTIPPWFSEQLPLTYELALEIGKFREEFANAVKKDLEEANKKALISMIRFNKFSIGKNAKEILDKMPINEDAKLAIFNYFIEQLLYAKEIPNDHYILIERTRDLENKRNYIIFHSLYGRRVNDALSRIFAIAFGDIFQTDVGIIINDNGFVLVFDPVVDIEDEDIKEIIDNITKVDVSRLIKENIKRTEMMKRRFRYCAARGFMILKNYKGAKISVNKQQINAQALLKTTELISEDFPIIKETYREILEDVMDLSNAKKILHNIRDKIISYKIIHTDLPSPFAHVLITFGEADIVMMKDRRKRLRELHEMVMKKIKEKIKD